MTNGPTRATVHPYRGSSCRNNLQQQVAPATPGSLGPLPFHAMVFLGPSPSGNTTLVREYLFVAVGPHSLRDASPGSESSPSSDGRFWGRRPLVRSTIVGWQEATDPQSPEGGGQGACHIEGAHPTASGASRREWRVSSLSQLIGPWVVALLVTLSQRGTASDTILDKDGTH